jgi:long-chain acyl-CoA synthetase
MLCAFWKQVEKRAAATAIRQKRSMGGVVKWIPMTWGELGERVARFASALQGLGLKPGEKFAIYSDNCQEWLIADYASQLAGLVSVPLYPNLTEEQIGYILEHSESVAIFVRGEARLKKLRALGPELIARLKKIIVLDVDTLGRDDTRLVSFEAFTRSGDPDPEPFKEYAQELDPGDIATISYTSGTTANPKGVMLSHHNIIFQSNALETRAARSSEDIVLSYLPLSHIGERINQFRQAARGYTVCFGGGLDTLAQDLKEIRPTSFMAVPRVYEKFHEAILARVSQAPPTNRKVFEKALTVSKLYLRERAQGGASLLLRLKLRVLQKLVGSKIRESLGLDRSKNFYSAAAPLEVATAEFFFALGVPIHEAYGLTECAGASHLNVLGNPVFGSVGPSLDGIECKIAPDGEVLLKGGNIFAGYFKDEAATQEAIQGGWFHTGDIGVVGKDSCLKITDRKKNIIVTSAGKNIAPAPLEAALKRHPLVSQAVVIGDKRKFLTALLTLVPGKSPKEAQAAIQQHVDALNATLASYETIKDFCILDQDFSIETGELTPTLKVKRNVVQTKYKALLDAMYARKSGGVEAPAARASALGS